WQMQGMSTVLAAAQHVAEGSATGVPFCTYIAHCVISPCMSPPHAPPAACAKSAQLRLETYAATAKTMKLVLKPGLAIL
ncbi:hypothetical protein OFM39_30825, partial [Escherichia coli]|nr:hypothetical protein [Escherichia coli]